MVLVISRYNGVRFYIKPQLEIGNYQGFVYNTDNHPTKEFEGDTAEKVFEQIKNYIDKKEIS